MKYTVLPGLTGNIIIHERKMYFDTAQKIWNEEEIAPFTLTFMRSKWIDYDSNKSFIYGGVRFLENGSYDMQNATNEQKFLYLIKINAVGYDGNFILEDRLFWAADNGIYRVGLYNTQEPHPYIEFSLKRSLKPEFVIQLSLTEEPNRRIRMYDRPIIEELSGFLFWDFWVECEIAIILDGKELFSSNKISKLIYLDNQLYSTRGRYIMTPRDSEKSVFPNNTVVLQTKILRFEDIAYCYDGRKLLSCKDHADGDAAICTMNSCDVYLADSKTGAKLGKMAKHETAVQMFIHHGFEYASAPKFPISYNAPTNGAGPRLCKHGLYVFITGNPPSLFVYGYERATNSGAHTKPARLCID